MKVFLLLSFSVLILLISGCANQPGTIISGDMLEGFSREKVDCNINNDHVILVGDKLAYKVQYPGGRYLNSESFSDKGKAHVVLDGVKQQKEFDYIDMLTDINGKLAYRGYYDKEHPEWGDHVLVYDGSEVKRGKVYGIYDINGNLGYYSLEGLFVFEGNQETRIDSEDAQAIISNRQQPITINGKFVYTAWDNNGHFIVYDGVETERYNMFGNNYIRDLIEVNGKLAYTVSEDFVVYDGVEGKEYDRVFSPVEVNNKLAYVAKDNAGNYFVVYDGVEGKKHSEYIRDLTGINGKLAYITTDSDGKEFVVYDGVESEKYYRVNSLKEIQNKLFYSAMGDRPGDTILIYDGNVVPDKGDLRAIDLYEINNKIMYIYSDYSDFYNRYIFIDNEEVGSRLDYVFVIESEDKLIISIKESQDSCFVFIEE
jgi:hypothetical protein